MAATFDPALTTDKDKVRQKIGDTDTAKAQIQDETIEAYLTAGLSVLGTARQLCLDLAAKWAPVGDVTLDDQMQRASKIYEHYIALAARLASEMAPNAGAAAAGASAIIVGGLDDCRGPLHTCCDDYGYAFYTRIPPSGP